MMWNPELEKTLIYLAGDKIMHSKQAAPAQVSVYEGKIIIGCTMITKEAANFILKKVNRMKKDAIIQ